MVLRVSRAWASKLAPVERRTKKAPVERGRSKLEVEMERQILLAGIERPTPEFVFHLDRKWRLDFAWVEAKVAVEVEGGLWTRGRHTRPAGFLADCEKYNTAQCEGWVVLRVAAPQIESGEALRWIEAALFSRRAGNDNSGGGVYGYVNKGNSANTPAKAGLTAPEGAGGNMAKVHPGFRSVQSKIAKKYGSKAAGAILAESTRNASPAAKKANPRLGKVK